MERNRPSVSFQPNVRAGLILLPLGLLAGLAMSLYAFHPIVKTAWVYDDLPRRLLEDVRG